MGGASETKSRKRQTRASSVGWHFSLVCTHLAFYWLINTIPEYSLNLQPLTLSCVQAEPEYALTPV